MHPRRTTQAPLLALVLVSLAILVATDRPSPILAAPPLPPIDGWEAPRIRVWTDDGWRHYQREGGVSLAPDRIYERDLAGGQAVTFHWSARPKTGRGEITGYRWALDMKDILDETPRSGPDDLSHWSAWSNEETSATVGPFGASPDSSASHFFFVEARDNLGFVSLVVVRLRIQAN